MVLICLMANDVERLFLCLFAIYKASPTILSFAHFSSWIFCFAVAF